MNEGEDAIGKALHELDCGLGIGIKERLGKVGV
jgi:hypothetical protein